MPRKPTVLQSEFPYHISARCINREWFSLPLPWVWKILSEQLYFLYYSFDVHILAFVLMNNHFHLMVQTPKSNLSDAMAWFMRESSRELVRLGNRINQTYGGPHFRSVIRSSHYYLHAYKYLYHNPIAANLCEDILEYPYSTLPGLLGRTPLLIPVQEDHTLFNDVDGTLRWLNSKPDEENWKAVRKALRRSEFRIGRENNRPHPLETDAL
jgi:REP element-mobilizing transposase RayT